MQFLTENLVDVMAPSNVPLVNPASAKATIDSAGANLARGGGGRLRPPVHRIGIDDLLVDDRADARLQGPGGEAPPASAGELDLDRVRVGCGKTLHLEIRVAAGEMRRNGGETGCRIGALGAVLLALLQHVGETVDRAEAAAVWAAQRNRPVPRVQHVLRGDRVAIRELDGLLQLDRVGHAVGRNPAVLSGGHLGRDVGDDVQLVVETPEVVEDVLNDLAVDLGVDLPWIPRLGVLQNREMKDLRFCQRGALCSAAAAAAGDCEDAERGHQHSREFHLRKSQLSPPRPAVDARFRITWPAAGHDSLITPGEPPRVARIAIRQGVRPSPVGMKD